MLRQYAKGVPVTNPMTQADAAIEFIEMADGDRTVETAKLTGMSESAVKVGIHRGLKALATRIRTTHEN